MIGSLRSLLSENDRQSVQSTVSASTWIHSSRYHLLNSFVQSTTVPASRNYRFVSIRFEGPMFNRLVIVTRLPQMISRRVPGSNIWVNNPVQYRLIHSLGNPEQS